MKTKILLLVANIMIFAMPLLATTTESDTIWTRRLQRASIKGCAFTLTGDSIIAITGEGGGDSLYILETATGNVLKRIGIRPWVYSFKGLTHFNTKSWIAIHISVDFGGMYIYDYINDSIINDKFGFMGKTIAITKNDDYLLVQNLNSTPNNISIYEVNNWKSIDSISSGYGAAHSLAISPDNKYLAIGTGKSKIVNPDPENPDYEEERMFDKIVVFNFVTKEIVKEFDEPYGTEGMIRDIKFSSDGKYLGVAKLDGTVRVYDMTSMVLYKKFLICNFSNESGPWIIDFSENSEYIYCGIKLYGQYNTKVWNIKNDLLIKTYDFCSYNGINTNYNDNVLIACDYDLTYLYPNWLTSVKDLIPSNKDTTNITISKSKNSTYQFKYNELIKNIKLFDYKGSIQNQSNVLKFNNEIITIETESLNLGIYFLSINSNHVPIKILVTE